MIRYTITIPSRYNNGTRVALALVDSFVHDAVKIAGGATLHGESDGYWRNADGYLVVEPVRVLEILTDYDHSNAVYALAHRVRRELAQETVLVTKAELSVNFV